MDRVTQLARLAARHLRMAALKSHVVLTRGVGWNRLAGLGIRWLDGYCIAFRRGTSDEGVLSHSFSRDIFFAAMPDYQPRGGDVVLDVGAHIGDFALLAARRVAPGQVFAVEPASETFEIMETNIALNRAGNVTADRLALAGHDGTCVLYHAPEGESWGDSTTHDFAVSREDVPCLRLATYMAERGISRIDFAKFNCEGGEFDVLLGSDTATLERLRRLVVLYHCDLAGASDLEKLLRHLEQAGKRTEIQNRTDERGWIIARSSDG